MDGKRLASALVDLLGSFDYLSTLSSGLDEAMSDGSQQTFFVSKRDRREVIDILKREGIPITTQRTGDILSDAQVMIDLKDKDKAEDALRKRGIKWHY